MTPAIYDIVVAVPPFVLACGSGTYKFAIVAETEPLVLVSEEGDMMWTATLYDGCVKSIGKAYWRLAQVAHDRWERARKPA